MSTRTMIVATLLSCVYAVAVAGITVAQSVGRFVSRRDSRTSRQLDLDQAWLNAKEK